MTSLPSVSQSGLGAAGRGLSCVTFPTGEHLGTWSVVYGVEAAPRYQGGTVW